MPIHFLMVLKRESLEGVGGLESLVLGCRGWVESPNHQWRGTKWSVGPGGGLAGVGTAGSGAPWKGDLGLPGTVEETDAEGWQTASGAWAGTAHNKTESKVGR